MAQPTVASTSTLAMVLTAESRGVRTADLLTAAGLSRAQIEDPDARLPAPAVVSLWSALRERTGDPALQLAAPLSLPSGAYRVVEYLLGASATVGDAVQRFARYFRLISDIIVLSVEPVGDYWSLTLSLRDGAAVPPMYVDYVFAAFVGRVRLGIRRSLQVARVELRPPAPRDPAPYAACFLAPVVFGASVDRLTFTRAEWFAPTDNPSPTLARILEEHARVLEAQLPSLHTDFLQDVQRAIISVLPEGVAARDAARALNCSVRTLQRRLDAAGETFRAVSERVRAQLARQYLADPAVSIAEVATLLGFSDATAFNRAFRRWSGDTPGRWRQRHTPRHRDGEVRDARSRRDHLGRPPARAD